MIAAEGIHVGASLNVNAAAKAKEINRMPAPILNVMRDCNTTAVSHTQPLSYQNELICIIFDVAGVQFLLQHR